ncbi:DUF1152 domain-containing protein [Terrabacter sp. GCM10028922]|uniref:DUF1152 domain-containing protein n=1 Tax=Terrabacter sp. GCM10028922 TaxID=3273428 RepID=UPI00360FCF40
MTTLFVAAGGGGDSVGVLLGRRVLDPEAEGPALITTCAWERLRVDPLPGPRPVEGFSGLGSVGGLAVEVLPNSDTIPSGRSMLPRVTAEVDARIFLHDFNDGVRGLTQQLRALATAVDADRLLVVDVGGDIVSTGTEPGLLSPLADSITLAAALSTGLSTSLAVLGPGADAELSEDDVIARLNQVGGRHEGNITLPDVKPIRPILTWHPTEASALVAAAALGARGAVEMRRGRRPTPLTEIGAEVWLIKTPRLEDFPLALAVAHTEHLDQARRILATLAVDEIAYEEDKAGRLRATVEAHPKHVSTIAAEAIGKGATHITTRRLLEQLNVAALDDDPVRGQLAASSSRFAGLWDLVGLDSARSD